MASSDRPLAYSADGWTDENRAVAATCVIRRQLAYPCAMVGLRGGSTDRVLGRDAEFARMESLLISALAGRGRLVLCIGEAGIGKTRLAEELAASAVRHGAVVAWARATDPASSPPYGLWRLLTDKLTDASAEIDQWPELRRMLEQPSSLDGLESASSQRFALPPCF